MTNIVCKCDEIIVKSEGGVTKVRSKILVLRDGVAFAVCKSCNAEVQVPLQLQPPAPPLVLELPAASQPPRLVLRK